MLLFYDTETTGFVQDKLPASHPSQPHIVQLAALLTEDDGTEISSIDVIVKPTGYTIPDGAAKVHGITTTRALAVGVPLILAVGLFLNLRHSADVVVAHNENFDNLVLDAAIHRLGRPVSKPWPTRYCTMNAALPILNLPPTARMLAAGFNKPKSPSLGECFQAFFNEPLDGAHNAMVDVRGCARVYHHLQLLARRDHDTLITA